MTDKNNNSTSNVLIILGLIVLVISIVGSIEDAISEISPLLGLIFGFVMVVVLYFVFLDKK